MQIIVNGNSSEIQLIKAGKRLTIDIEKGFLSKANSGLFSIGRASTFTPYQLAENERTCVEISHFPGNSKDERFAASLHSLVEDKHSFTGGPWGRGSTETEAVVDLATKLNHLPLKHWQGEDAGKSIGAFNVAYTPEEE
jgi:hypothetical protein